MRIQHNLAAMQSVGSYIKNNKALSGNLEKLSSGYKINKAADDAAGLAISEKMRRQIRGLDQGSNNVQDGISLLQVADGALSEVHDMLNRVTELATQSSNGTYSSEDRDVIQQEITQIMCEVERISDSTEFNGKSLFKGGSEETVIPAVYDEPSINTFSVSGTPTDTTPKTYKITADETGFKINDDSFSWDEFKNDSGTLADADIAAGKYTFTYNGMTLSVNADSDASLDDAVKLINGASFKVDKLTYENVRGKIEISMHKTDDPRRYSATATGISIGTPRFEYKSTYSGPGPYSYDYEEIYYYPGIEDTDGNEIYFHGVLRSDGNNDERDDYNIIKTWYNNSFYYDPSDPDEMSKTEIKSGSYTFHLNGYSEGGNRIIPWTQLYLNLDVNEDTTLDKVVHSVIDGTILYKDTTNADGTITRNVTGIGYSTGTVTTSDTIGVCSYSDSGYKGVLISPEQRISSESGFNCWIQTSDESKDGMNLNIERMNTEILGIDNLDVSTIEGAENALGAARKATDKVSKMRANIGAFQNRLEHTYNNVTNEIEDTQASESRIRDANMAKEMTEYSKNNVILQASQSMLAQANASNQGVLSLLQ